MPAPRQTGRSSVLPTIIPKRVDNTLSLEKYYRSADLLVRQAAEYRAQHNDLQLYTMLMRLASLVLETIPKHKDFRKGASTYVLLRKDLKDRHLNELEGLKMNLQLQRGEDQENWIEQPGSRTSDAVQISSSNLPQLDWGQMPSRNSGLGSPASFDADLLDSFSSMSLQGNSGAIQPRPSSATSLKSDFGLPTFTSSIKPVSQATRDRHALMPSLAPTIKRQSSSSGPMPSYPTFDSSPWKPIDYGTSNGNQNNSQSNPTAPPLSLEGPNSQNGNSLMDMDVHPRPSPMLGPQEYEVQRLAPLDGPPDPSGTCSHVPPPPPPRAPEDQPGEVKRIKGLREVHVAVKLMEEFLHYAGTNTKRNVESCGILAGKLDTEEGIFRITTLIIPKQQGTSDTVQALAEEEIFEAQDSRSLYPMGWIHTHPSQTCFLSSIDVHTQCGYQTMLEEAVAIVMAPTDRNQKCGIFRLDTPAGLKMVQNCPLQGFHHHPMPGNNPIYDLCGHVFLNERIKHEVVDLR